jgi:NADH dehydrogenase
VQLGEERVSARTVLWAAGVQASPLGQALCAEVDRQGRVPVEADLTLAGHSNVFIAGDQARFVPSERSKANKPSADHDDANQPLPGVATVALQQGHFVADAILATERGKQRGHFSYWDKGQLATIGRSRAILQSGNLQLAGFLAWVAWLFVHIYYLSGFKNRLFVLLQWAWSYMTFARGARLITERRWRSY